MAGVFKNISSQDRRVNPFKAYKSWSYNTTSSIDSSEVNRLVAIKPDPSVFSGNKVTLDTDQRKLDLGSNLINIADNKESSVIWYSLNHLYYKRPFTPSETFGNSNPYAIERTLFKEASVISVPQRILGESIKPGSVILNFKNSQLNSSNVTLIDDGNGNLIDTELSSSISGEVLYLGFNDSTYETNWTANSTTALTDNKEYIIKAHTNINDLVVKSKNVWLSPIYNIPSSSYNWSDSAIFHGNGYIRIPYNESLNFKSSNDFAISFWAYRASSNSEDVYLVSKRTTGFGDVVSNGMVKTGDVNYNSSQYPFEILYQGGTDTLICRQSSGGTTTSITTTINVGDTFHVLFQKSGTSLQLYINNRLISTRSAPAENIQNKADIFIGSLGLDGNGDGLQSINGAIDEFFIFNKALTQSEVTQLSYTGSMNLMTTNTNVVGNVFYEHGIIVISDPRPKYGTSSARMFNDRVYNLSTGLTQPGYLDSFYFEFNSTVTLYEHEYVCRLKEDEFNFTTNPTIRLDNDENSEIPKSIVYTEGFSSYITTIGLYTDNGELIAIGKLASPIKKRDDIDTTIVVRFDM
jgi:hypothetical protein